MEETLPCPIPTGLSERVKLWTHSPLSRGIVGPEDHSFDELLLSYITGHTVSDAGPHH